MGELPHRSAHLRRARRIPNLFEVESIRNMQNVNPSVGSAFNSRCVAACTVTSCSCTQSNS